MMPKCNFKKSLTVHKIPFMSISEIDKVANCKFLIHLQVDSFGIT